MDHVVEKGTLKIVKLAGGLGNQLFQYCFGQYLTRQFDCRVKYFNELGSPSLWAVSQFVPDIDYCSNDDLAANGYAFSKRVFYRIKRKICELFPRLDRHIMVETGSLYHNRIGSETRVFDGYWQSYKYLPNSFRVASPSLPLPHVEEITKSNAVFVHLRRGDYLKKANRRLFAICDIGYFQRAISELMSRLEQPIFYVFSNDIAWAKANLNVSGAKLRYIINEGEHADVVDFLEMTYCKHAIISNSTFSWWAAWLIKGQNKQVIAPKEWYLKPDLNEATKDLIPSSWTRM